MRNNRRLYTTGEWCFTDAEGVEDFSLAMYYMMLQNNMTARDFNFYGADGVNFDIEIED